MKIYAKISGTKKPNIEGDPIINEIISKSKFAPTNNATILNPSI